MNPIDFLLALVIGLRFAVTCGICLAVLDAIEQNGWLESLLRKLSKEDEK